MVVAEKNKSARKGTPTRQLGPCCKHNPRMVSMPQALFVDWAGEESESEWSLFFVKEQPGDDPHHTFFKYVLFCTTASGNSATDANSLLHACKGWRKYEEAFSGVRPRDLFRNLGQLWDDWGFGSKDTDEQSVNHFHIGILGASPFNQYVEENEAEWMHLRPDLPSVHRKEDVPAQSEPESLTESEIFRRFAFENDEQDRADTDWTVVKPKGKALEGCLPFCFEADRNIFPDHNGVFRHYCRAEAVWQCRRKTCKRSGGISVAPLHAKKDESGERDNPTSWRSGCSWYHEHLKDKETQGLRRGFERQYCGECWRSSKEWVEGKMCKFFKPGTFALEDDDVPNRGKGRHNPEFCEVCQRLSEKGFSESCVKFSAYLAKGKVKVSPGSTGWDWV
eukprot:CAMPEP_0170615212 /NCGR_PEP_ID=MMETSP0224-20130122/25217_1 /TAXON_ID=285029 /ORGANISM="Togula jolla, Strain CCCM 725" /LENGTH=391 /DNA_ID=CAMNT_0010940929 /DNA_START=156 /DNA_END=1331 /DNA_ORIENTATION=-